MEKEKNAQEAKEQLDQVLNEIDGIPDENKEIVRIDSEYFKFNHIAFKLIENHQDAFDLEMMENRFTDYLLKYDYIVGDISYEKLRLRGFYEDYRKGIPIDMKISNLEDYLVEYCSFGCPYFVFERVEKPDSDPESYFKKKKTSRSNKQNKQNKHAKQRSKPNTKKSSSKQKEQKNFQVKKKEKQTKKQKSKKSQSHKQQQENKETVQFKIRKKKD